MGFPTYGEGPFEDVGIHTTVPLLVAFLLVCVAELVTGWLLWPYRRYGGLLALGLLPLVRVLDRLRPAARTHRGACPNPVLVFMAWSSLRRPKA